jgi:hypothetical protein
MKTNEIRSLTGKIIRFTQYINKYSNHLKEFCEKPKDEISILRERISRREIEISWQKYLCSFSETRRLREVKTREIKLKEANLGLGDKNYYNDSHSGLIKQLNIITQKVVWEKVDQEEIDNFKKVIIELDKAIKNIKDAKNEISGLTTNDPDELFIEKIKQDLQLIVEEIDYLNNQYNLSLPKPDNY